MSDTNKTQSNPAREVRGRDGKGRFKPGHSGNPSGRPRQYNRKVQSISEVSAAALRQEVTYEGSDGKKRRVTRYEKIIFILVERLPEAKAKEQLDILLQLQKLGALPQPPVLDDLFPTLDPAMAGGMVDTEHLARTDPEAYMQGFMQEMDEKEGRRGLG